MRILPLVFACAAIPLCGEEPPPASGLRDRMHARIMEALPPLAAAPADETPEPVIWKSAPVDDDVVVLEPFIVVEPQGVRGLAARIQREQEQREAEQFSVRDGGTLLHRGRLKIGAWPGSGGRLALLKFDF